MVDSIDKTRALYSGISGTHKATIHAVVMQVPSGS